MGDEIRGFAATLGPDDAVALEASTNTWALADLLGAHAGRVVVSSPLRTRAIASAERKTDDIDAATLAELLAADYLPPVWQPDEATRRLRRLVSHRAGLRDGTAVRNRVIALLSRRLLRSPVTDLFGVRGRAWLAALEVPLEERLALDAAIRLDTVLSEQVEVAERAIATAVVDDRTNLPMWPTTARIEAATMRPMPGIVSSRGTLRDAAPVSLGAQALPDHRGPDRRVDREQRRDPFRERVDTAARPAGIAAARRGRGAGRRVLRRRRQASARSRMVGCHHALSVRRGGHRPSWRAQPFRSFLR